MAGSYNKIVLVGNLGADPEHKSFANGGSVVNMRLATSRDWKDKQTGERREAVQWHQIVIRSEPVGKIAMQYCKKGSKLLLEGELEYRDYEKDGQKHRVAEIVISPFTGQLTMLDGKSDGTAPSEPRQASPQKPANNGGRANAVGDSAHDYSKELDDSLPF